MPRKSSTRRTVTVDTEDIAELDPFERARVDFGDAIEGAEVKLDVYRFDDLSRAQKYVCRVIYKEEEHTLDWIRSACGPGKYNLRFQHRGSGKSWAKVVDIGAAPGERDASEPPPSLLPSKDNDLTMMLKEQNAVLMRMIGAGASAGVTAGGGTEMMLEWMRQTSELNRTLIMSAVSKPDASEQLFNVAGKVMELVSDMKMDAEGGWIAQVPRIAKELGPILRDSLAAAPASPPALLPDGAPGPARAAPVARTLGSTVSPPAPVAPSIGFVRTGPGNNPMDAAPPVSDIREEATTLKGMLASYGSYFLESARAANHPGDMANSVLDSVPVVYHDKLDEIEEADILEAAPGLANHRPWVADFIRYVRERGYESTTQEAPPTLGD